jgi:hypothetical protein
MRSSDQTKLSAFGFSDPDKKDLDHELACIYLAQEEIARKLVAIAHPDYERATESCRQASEKAKKALGSNVHAVITKYLLDQANHEEEKDKRSGGETWSQWDDRGKKMRGEFTEFVKAAGFFGRTVYVPTEECEIVDRVRAKTEVHIQKGSGQYATSIGWADVLVKATIGYGCKGLALEVQDGCVSVRGRGEDVSAQFKAGFYRPVYCLGIEVKIGKVPVSDAMRQISFYRSYMDSDTGWMLVAPWDITESERDALTRSNVFFVKLGAKFEEFKRNQSGKIAKAQEV